MVEGLERQPIVLLLCPICGSLVKSAYKDDIGTQFYECEKCHEKTANPIKKTYKPMMYERFSSFCDENEKFNPAKFGNDPITKKWKRAIEKFETLTSLDLHEEDIKEQEPKGEISIGRPEAEHILIVTKAMIKYAEELLEEKS